MQHVLSFSGGKDSTAMYLLALEQGWDFLPVFADTGNEHEITIDYVRELAAKSGGPEIRWVKADFSEEIARKRKFVAEKWPERGVPPDRIARALAVVRPTGVPFLDLCLLKGRFPSTRARFCSSELKHIPIFEQVMEPLLEAGETVVSWQGVRAEESGRRAALPKLERLGGGLFNWRPLLNWTWQDVFEIHRRHGVEPNPLYRLGAGRVGCMPCIHARKDEVANIAARFPEHVARIAEWEQLVGEASKRGRSSFFSHDKTPGDHQGRTDIPMPGIYDVVEWAKTSRGGRQYDAFRTLIDPPQCSSLVPVR